MYGVMTAMMQFQNQLLAVESATPRERIGRGKISPITTQAAMRECSVSKPSRAKDIQEKEGLTRTPSGGKEEDVEADEGNLSSDSSRIIFRQTALGNTDNADDELADNHTHGTPDQN